MYKFTTSTHLKLKIMKCLSFRTLNKFTIIKSTFRNMSTAKEKNVNFTELQKLSRKVIFSKHISRSRIMELENVMSITVLMNQVSWAKISLPTLKVLEWNYCNVLDYFKSDMEEFVILKMIHYIEPLLEESSLPSPPGELLMLAHTVKQQLPVSDLYIMESFPFRWKQFSFYLMLRFMLIPLLTDGLSSDSKIFFQRPQVVNILHGLLIGGERVSATKVVEEKLLKAVRVISDENDENLEETSQKSALLPNLNENQIHNFIKMSPEIQESLSVALLIAWSFADVIYFQNLESIDRLQKNMKTKILSKNLQKLS